ncbi:MAG: ABC transporter ATP-binding protein [Meiothermus silvanus]|nr:ABC transporter ATP-binding protein [Allomeiothermus silvanus]
MSLGSRAYLSLEEVSVYYDKVRAIEGVSLEAEKGEVIALIGANGAGKTTTMRAITGLARLAAGAIYFAGQRISGLPPHRIAEMGVRMVPEGRRIFPLMSVRDNLLMGAFTRRDHQGIQEDLERIFNRFPRLRERARQTAGTLSGGEQEMVAIGRALMARPRLLLLDEPSLGLAPLVVREIARTLLAISREEGVTIVLVEQNARMALQLSSRAYLFETGRVALQGYSEELRNDDRVRRVYLGGADA